MSFHPRHYRLPLFVLSIFAVISISAKTIMPQRLLQAMAAPVFSADTIPVTDTIPADTTVSQDTIPQEEDPCLSSIPIDTLDFCTYENALPFSYGDSIYSEAGTYPIHYITSLGCDSTIVINLSVLGETTDTLIAMTICSNELPFEYDHRIYERAGLYTVKTSSSSGCDSVAYRLDLSVNEVPTPHIHGPHYLCRDYSATLSIDALDIAGCLWSTGADSLSTTISHPGIYSVMVASSSGCIAKDTFEVIHADDPEISILGDTSICSGDSITLWAVGGGLFQWSTGDIADHITINVDTDTSVHLLGYDTLTYCFSTDTMHISVFEKPSVSITSDTATICYGDSVFIEANGGVAYLWSTGDTTRGIYAKDAGAYFVIATNEAGCSDTAYWELEVRNLPSIEFYGRRAFCREGSTTITASGADTYHWSTGEESATVTLSEIGTYEVACTDTYGCTTDTSITLIFSQINATLSGNRYYCQGSSTTIRVVGDSSNTYLWNDGTLTDSLTISSVGTYSVLVTNELGCSNTLSVNISEYALPTPSITSLQGTYTTCQGNDITLRATGGSRYLWNTGNTSEYQTVSTSGIYTVVVTNNYGCSASISEHVTVNPLPSITFLSNDTICQGDNVTIYAASTTGRTYSWSTGQNTSSITVSPNNTTTYLVTVFDNNNCSNSGTKTIHVVRLPLAYINGPTAMCQGDTVLLTASEGTQYQWSNGMTTQSISASAAGQYSVNIYNAGGCFATVSTTLSLQNLPVATITENTSICEGESAVLSVTSNPGYTYAWSNNSNASSISVREEGTYSVTITNANNCHITLQTTVQINTKPQVNISGNTAICQGTSSTLTATSLTPCQFVWSTGDTNAYTRILNSGTYTVTATNRQGCSNTASVNAIIRSLPTPSITGTTTICRGSSTTLTATGGYTYRWSNGETTNRISVSPTTTTNYSVTATDQYGCSASTSSVVSVNVAPAITINGERSFCVGGTTTVSANGGINYSWSSGETSSTITVGTTGTYFVTVTNSLGCQSVDSVTIVSKELPYISVTGDNRICSGSSATLSAIGAMRYVWSTGENTPAITVTPTSTTTYTVTGYGSNGCSSSTSKVVNVDALPDILINGVNTICQGENTTLTAMGGESYIWGDGTVSSRITVNESGIYTVQGVSAQGCVANKSFTLTVNPSPHIMLSGNPFFCENASTQMSVSGGTSYLWSDGTTSDHITIQTSGNYMVTATNDYGCSVDTTFFVRMLPAPVVYITGTTTICEGSIGYLTAGGNASSYLWDNGETSTSIVVSPSEATTYHVTATSADGCTAVAEGTISINPSFHQNINDNICQGASYTQHGFNIPVQTEPGTYIFHRELQTYTGCDSIITLILTVNPLPTLNGEIEGPEQTSSYGDYFYNIDPGENVTNYEWRISNTHWTITNNNINSTFLTVSTSGNGLLTVKAINGCGFTEKSLAINCNVGIDDYTDENILLYPNPASQYLHINIEKSVSSISDIQLLDNLGRMLQHIDVNDSQLTVDCNAYATGTYFIRFYDHDGAVISTRKIIISK